MGASPTDQQRHEPLAWRRQTQGEHRWPAALTIGIAIALQLILPDRLALGPRWALPALSALLLVGLMLIAPGRIERHHSTHRRIALVVVAVVSAANAASAVQLVYRILDGTMSDATALLSNGAAIYCTNIVVFSLWYWEFDRGGPGARAMGLSKNPDFMFPQMANPEMAAKDWEPTYVDYLYLSFTNATAFSPTDVMPMHRWTKMTMLAQSTISLVLVVLVLARAVNILH